MGTNAWVRCSERVITAFRLPLFCRSRRLMRLWRVESGPGYVGRGAISTGFRTTRPTAAQEADDSGDLATERQPSEDQRGPKLERRRGHACGDQREGGEDVSVQRHRSPIGRLKLANPIGSPQLERSCSISERLGTNLGKSLGNCASSRRLGTSERITKAGSCSTFRRFGTNLGGSLGRTASSWQVEATGRISSTFRPFGTNLGKSVGLRRLTGSISRRGKARLRSKRRQMAHGVSGAGRLRETLRGRAGGRDRR